MITKMEKDALVTMARAVLTRNGGSKFNPVMIVDAVRDCAMLVFDDTQAKLATMAAVKVLVKELGDQ